jgi:predicted GNAT family N-acyltransferase
MQDPEEAKISMKDLRIEVVSSENVQYAEGFETDNKELRDFLVEDALKNQEVGISTTYLWFYNPGNQLAAYVTILMDAIRVSGDLRDSFLGQGIGYKTLPALKIGRLCVDKKYERKGIGKNIIYFVMEKAIHLSEEAGCRFIVVDAKKESEHFYRKLGFDVLREREKGTIPMYFDIIDLLRLYKEHKIKLKDSISKRRNSV